MDNKELQSETDKLFGEYIMTRRDDEWSYNEYYNTPKGFAMSVYKDFLEYYGLEIPGWMKSYYEEPDKE